MNEREQPQALIDWAEPRSSGKVAAQASLISSASESSRFGSQPSYGSESSVELHIEELVLHDFAADDRYRIGDALARELTRLFIEQGVPPAITQSGEIARVDGGAFEVPPGSNSETTGAQLAKAIYGGFGK